MLAVKMEVPHSITEGGELAVSQVVLESEGGRKVKEGRVRKEEKRELTLRPGYMYRESNWEIGRAAERAGVRVKKFKPRDRWTAWKKREVRFAKNAEKRSLGRKIGGK
jgi:hypothetical protein